MPDTFKAAEYLQRALIGQFYSRVSVHNAFELQFEDFTLAGQEVESPDEELFNTEFVHSYVSAGRTANPQVIAKSAILAACLGACISRVELAANASLTLTFENGVSVTFTTATPIVDWHWAITEGGQDPYSGCIVACFSPGEVQGGIANSSFKPKPLRGSA
jgi:hypothetical protein